MNKQLVEARDLLEAELFHSDVDRLLRDALRAQYAGYSVWMQDTSDSEVVFEVSPREPMVGVSTTFRAGYTIDAANQVAFGDPVQVERKTVYVPVGQTDAATEAMDFTTDGEFVALLEKAVRKDGTMPIKIIQPGRGSSGFYPAAVLERDGPKVFTKGLHMYIDHPTATEAAERPERSIRDLAAVLTTDARWDAQGKAGPGLYAEATVAKPWQPFVEELAPHIGVSIRADGRFTMGEVDGEPMKIIQEITSARSADLVTRAGAGGQILSLFESARNRVAVEMKPTYLEADMANEQELQEARNALTAKEAEVETLTEANAAKDTELARLREGAILREAETFIGDTLPTTVEGIAPAVWDLVRARLAETLNTKMVVKDGALDKDAFKTVVEEAVKAEVKYLAEITGSGTVRGNGGPVGDDGDKLAEAKAQQEAAWLRMGKTLEEAKRLTEIRR